MLYDSGENKKWVSTQIENFFNNNINNNGKNLLDFFTFYLDSMQDENYLNDKINPIYFIENIKKFIDIDKNPDKNLYENLIPVELKSIVDKNMTWQKFVLFSKRIFNTKGSTYGINFWTTLVSNINIKELYYDNIEDVALLTTLGFESSVYSQDGFLVYDKAIYNKIPNIFLIENLDINSDYTLKDLISLLNYLKPLGVIFLMLKFILIDSLSINITPQSVIHTQLDSNLQIYPDYENVTLEENHYTLMDYYLDELKHVQLSKIEDEDLYIAYLEYGYDGVLQYIASPPSTPFAFNDNMVIFDFNVIEYESESNQIDDNIDGGENIDFNDF